MEKQEIILDHSRSTNNTVVYTARSLSVVSSVYVHKSAFSGGDVPKSLKLTLEENHA